MDHAVVCSLPILEREIEMHEVDVDVEYSGLEHSECLEKELLACLAAVADDKRKSGHDPTLRTLNTSFVTG
jgi:hypothetical protein